MFKKCLLAAAILAATSSIALANGGSFVPPPHHCGDFYIGAGISSDMSFLDTELEQIRYDPASAINPTIITIRKKDYGADGWNGELLAGYGHTFMNNIYLGGEIFGQYSSARGSIAGYNATLFSSGSTTVEDESAKIQRTLGIAIAPGYRVAPGSLFYGRVGYINTRFEANFVGNSVPYSPFTHNAGLQSFDKNANGLQLGLGVNTQVSNHISIQEGYNWNFYQKFSETIITTDTTGMFQVKTVPFNPVLEQFNLNFIYHFAPNPNDIPDHNSPPAHVGHQFYVGLLGSRDNGIFNNVVTEFDFIPMAPAPDTIVEQRNLDARGWDGELLVGYGYTFPNRYYLGDKFLVIYLHQG